MRKMLLLLLMITTGALFAGGYGMAGCGLGSMVVKSNGTLQVFAATTNGIGFQTFAISTGTSNCTGGGVLIKDMKKLAFIEATMPQLKQNAASGKGEHLTALGSMYQCSGDASKVFNLETQKHFQQIFKTGHKAHDVQKAVESMILKNQTLKKSCII